jgi:tRNA pseudouridine38-40 synthase
MQTWKLTLAYDGTAFHGWQVQLNLRTIQGTLADALHRMTGESILPQGSGRTDAGVHALGQVASFQLEAPIPAANLQHALNRALPSSIRVLAAEIVPEDFHARRSAQRKTYEYRIFLRKAATNPGAPSSRGFIAQGGVLQEPGFPASGFSSLEKDRICSPMLAPFVWDCPLPLDLSTMKQAASHVVGTHDFTSFAASDPDLATREAEPDSPPPSPVRTLSHSQWTEQDGLLLYRITGSGFLHHMVRNLVGTFVHAGTGRIAPESIPAILAARDRSAAGPTAPASGLFLMQVEYSAEVAD